ncbi:hypothetical protein M3P21_08770 [Ruegeria sp. 2012CJ41-6]|uniref:Uncharacterized protein n=1 Tax=Ruegeria spongiae TaxID=2942209 RepID=A0ABT0Q2H1_9RHOB|nr:hypothetical protein [Ruegeria spongiae]MCL6283622.1 hypothetical protein [Ruegeria spongiae]
MPITVTQKEYARAVGVHADTVSRRLRDVQYTGGERNRQYHLAAVLPTLTARERGGDAVKHLFDVATTDDTIWVGDDVTLICQRFREALTPEESTRLFECEVSLTSALSSSLRSSELFRYIDVLRLKLPLHHGVLRYTMMGDPRELPNWPGFCVPWAICNTSHENLVEERIAA